MMEAMYVADNSPAYVNKHKVCDAITIAADEFNSNIFFNCTIYILSSLKIPQLRYSSSMLATRKSTGGPRWPPVVTGGHWWALPNHG
jgi:hypothetical protein